MLWTLVVFFGASILFATIRNATEGESAGLTLALQVLAMAALIGVIVVIVRRQR